MGEMEGKRKKLCSLACAGLVLFLGLLLITGGILVLLLFRSFVHTLIMSEIPLRPGSQVTEAWIKPPVKPLLQMFFFNTTNPEGFLRGEKPLLVEVGPYVYEEEWEKVDVTWGEEGDSVKYRLKKVYKYRQDLSGNLRESDRLTLPNVPMFASVNQMRNAGRLVQSALSSMLEILKQEVFNSTSVRDIIWGYDHPLIKLGNDVLPEEKRLPFDKFGFFVNKNHSVSGVWETMTGVDEVKDVAKVIPILWFTDGVEDLEDEDTISLLQTAVHTPEMARNLLYPIMLVVGVLMVLATMAFVIRRFFFLPSSTMVHPVTEMGNLPISKGGYGNGAFSYEHPQRKT